METSLRNKYYPWLVMAACCIVSAIVMGMGVSCSGLFMKPIAASLSAGLGEVAMYATIMGGTCALTAPIVGYMVGKIDLRLLLTVGVTCSAGGTALLGRITGLWQLYLLGAVIGLGVTLSTSLVMTVVLNNWFVKNTGLAIGITLSGSSVTGIVMNPVLNVLIGTIGWRRVYTLVGVAIAVICLPLVWGVIRMWPSQKGVRAWGEDEMGQAAQAVQADATPAPDLKGELRSMGFAYVFLYVMLSSLALVFLNHFPTLADTAGLGTAVGATMISVGMVGELSGKLFLGALSDRIGVFKAALIVTAMAALAFCGLIFVGFVPVTWVALGAAFLYGPAQGVFTVGLALMTKQMFPAALYSRIYPWFSVIGLVAFSAMFPLVGFVFDKTGSFFLPLAAGAAILVLSCLCLIACDRIAKKKAAEAVK